MSEVIQCPTCSKKFRLPDSPPAQFTCTSCGTLMDLSAFGGQAPAAPAVPAAASASSRRAPASSGGGAPSSRKRRSGSRTASRGRSRAGARGDDDGYEDEGRRGRGRPQKQNNNALLWGSLVGLLVIGGIAIAVMSGDKDEETPTEEVAKGTPSSTPATPSTLPGTQPGVAAPTGTSPSNTGTPTPAAPAPTPGTTPAAPAATEPAPTAPARTRPKSIKIKDIELKIIEFPESVSAEVRAQAEAHVVGLLAGGREFRDAEAWFMEQGNKVAPALISQFKRNVDEKGMETPGAMGDLMVLDVLLSKMDGFIARKWGSTEPLTHASTPNNATARMKRWVAWWERGYWEEPVKPWDERFDEIDPDAPKPKDDEVGREFDAKKSGD